MPSPGDVQTQTYKAGKLILTAIKDDEGMINILPNGDRTDHFDSGKITWTDGQSGSFVERDNDGTVTIGTHLPNGQLKSITTIYSNGTTITQYPGGRTSIKY